jgi:hypothetical protein
MPQLVNLALMREPLNWLIVFLMLAIAGFGLCLVFGGEGGQATS